MNTSSPSKARFNKGDIRIFSDKYPEELIVKVCLTNPEKPVLLCLEDIMDDPDFVKDNKKMIVPIEQYLSDMVHLFEGMKEKKHERMDSMPKKILDFYENYYRVRDTFKETMDNEKSQVSGIFK